MSFASAAAECLSLPSATEWGRAERGRPRTNPNETKNKQPLINNRSRCSLKAETPHRINKY